jgi:hypothetical protein
MKRLDTLIVTPLLCRCKGAMGKTFEVSDMPALSREFHDELRGIEHQFGKALSRCISSMDELFDPNAAFEYARTYAIEFYDLFYGFYSRYPDYREHWRPASEAFALQRVIQCLNNYSVLQAFLNRDHRIERIRRTISDHAQRVPPPLIPGKLPSAYAASGIDVASGSPLLKMAAASPPSVWAPVPRKRIGRSIHSEKAARRMEAYFQDKCITQTQFSVTVDADIKTLYRFRKTGKVDKSVAKRIANAMGITLEQFTA